MARPGRLELPTLCLEGRRSFRLSYGRVVEFCLILKHFQPFPKLKYSLFQPYCARTVPKPSFTGSFWHSVPIISLAWRLSFSRASRFICNFI